MREIRNFSGKFVKTLFIMPFKRKREIESEHEENKMAKISCSSKPRVLLLYDSIGYQDDHWHSLFRSIPQDAEEFKRVLCKEVCSFLNGSGGIICFGCRSNGKIYGEDISRKFEDQLRLAIDESIKRFRPFVSPSNYRVIFTPIFDKYSSCSRYILEIKVSCDNSYELFETENHESYLRTKDGAPYGPLTPHEIKQHVLQQYKKKLENEEKIRSTLHQRPRSKPVSVVQPYNTQPTTSKAVPHPLSVYNKAPPTTTTSVPAYKCQTDTNKLKSELINHTSINKPAAAEIRPRMVKISRPRTLLHTPPTTATIVTSTNCVPSNYRYQPFAYRPFAYPQFQPQSHHYPWPQYRQYTNYHYYN